MAYNLRYFINYMDNASGLPVVVNISFPDFADTALELIPADTPCMVSELNSDQNIFSCIRAKEFRIKFVTDNNIYPGINEFATNSDNDWKIDILFNGALWLTGFILTDQISEGWYTDNTNHYIELVATDNLGTLKKLSLKDMDGNDFVPTIKQFLIDIIKPALNQAIANLSINIFDNLFEVGFTDRTESVTTLYEGFNMLSATASTKEFAFYAAPTYFHIGDTFVLTGTLSNDGTYTVTAVGPDLITAYITVLETVVDETYIEGVDFEITHLKRENDSYQQCMVDMRTFTLSYNTFEDAYTVLTKILESRNSVLFQHLGEWYIVRVSELFRSDVINGTRYSADGPITAIINASWTANVNQSGDIIPVEQFMIKSFLNPVLSNKVTYNYRSYDELLCNEFFQRGAIGLDTSSVKEYDVDCWGHYIVPLAGTNPSTVIFRRREVIDPATGVILENYIFLEHEPGTTGGGSFIRSEETQVNKDDKITISFNRRLKNGYVGNVREGVAVVMLRGYNSVNYTFGDDGIWHVANSTFSNARAIFLFVGSDENTGDWKEVKVTSEYVPADGDLQVVLMESSQYNLTGQESQFKDFKLTVLHYIEGKTAADVDGDYHKLTLATQLKDTAEYEVFLSDSPKYLFKGALFEADGVTLTRLWYEADFPDTQYPIKRFNAIDHYRMSNRNMIKAEGDFYKWVKGGEPINSVQKITITNGDSNKRFLPAFIRDLDTSASRFSSLFIEVFDTTKEATHVFTQFGEFIAPDTFEYPAGFDVTWQFNVGDTLTISDTASNNVTVTVVSKTVGDPNYTIIFSGATITDETLGADATFTDPEHYQVNNDVNADHEFAYIFKPK